jgi:hypothetical protein
VFSKVHANLSSIDKLFSSTELWKQTTAQDDQSQFLTIISANTEPSVNRLYVATVRSCNVPPCPMERDLHRPLAAIQMALPSLTLSMRLTRKTGSNLRCNSPKHS